SLGGPFANPSLTLFALSRLIMTIASTFARALVVFDEDERILGSLYLRRVLGMTSSMARLFINPDQIKGLFYPQQYCVGFEFAFKLVNGFEVHFKKASGLNLILYYYFNLYSPRYKI
ncbi:hypothetical protein ACJX0J_008523, partial [Zea mays]